MNKELRNQIIDIMSLNEEEELDIDSLMIEYPCNDLVISVKAYDLLKTKQDNEARLLLDAKVKECPDLIKSTFYNWIKGVFLEINGDYQQSYEFYHTSYLLDTEKENPWVRLSLYNVLLENDTIQAMEYLTESLEMSDVYIDAWIEKGAILENEGDKIGALKIYNTLLEKKKNPYIYNALGRHYLINGDVKSAKEAFLKSIEIKTTADGFMGLGDIELYFSNHYPEALEYYQQAIKEKDVDYVAFIRNGNVLNEMERFSEAKYYFEKAYEMYPCEDNLCLMIYNSILNDDLSGAGRILNDLIHDFGKSKDSIFFEILLYSKKGDIDNANKKVDELLRDYSAEDIGFVTENLSAWGINIIRK